MQVILTHENTDMDALASLLAAKKLYPEAEAVLPRHPNRNLRDFLALYEDEMPFVYPDDLPREKITRIILVDTQSASSIRGMRPGIPTHIIDHHPLSREEKEITYEGEPLGATTTMLTEHIREKGLSITPLEATLMLMGIYEDTGSLSYTGTKPRDAQAAAWLLEQGADLKITNRFLNHPLTAEQRQLLDNLVQNSEIKYFAKHPVLIATARPAQHIEEISSLVHQLRNLFDPAATFMLVQFNGEVQMVARSSTAQIDAGLIAVKMGGGGHREAAAAFISDSNLGEAREKLTELLQAHAKPAVTVRELMSHRALTLKPDLTLEEAEKIMKRYSYEGFPVVEQKRVVGVLTRRDLERALRYQQEHKPIRAYMHKGEIAVTANDAVERLQAVMTEYGVGQVPVVEDGEIIGIVTRTDLLKLWATPTRPSQRIRITQLMQQIMPAAVRALLRQAGDIASQLDYSLYIVGGFPRDLLLKEPNYDLDMVVEGDAIELVHELVKVVGGRMRSHARFGTATWLPDSPLKSTILELQEQREELARFTIDFVTARVEYYKHATALPTVESSSIKQDLYRRDFTINTMAICLDHARYGELLDYYGGQRDLEAEVIRVLHNLSFVEDPTRILRAVRLEQRLGFKIEENTEELALDAVDLLTRVSGERIRHELFLIWNEPEPERAMRRLDQLGALQNIHSAWSWREQYSLKFRELRDRANWWRGLDPAEGKDLSLVLLYFGMSMVHLSHNTLDELIRRLRIKQHDARVTVQMKCIYANAEKLSDPDLSPSAVDKLLSRATPTALYGAWVALESEMARERIVEYYTKLRHVKAEIDGEYLKNMNIEPGPLYSEILNTLRAARLDGVVKTLADEEAMVKEMLRERETSTAR